MNYFVYVVCGAKEYIEELNFSLKYLRHFSEHPIIVITETTRNEIKIEHDLIIDIKTPKNLGNHQAHLYLETKLPKILKPKANEIYCYLDSDVIAISSEINSIFIHFSSPVLFAQDHCTIDYFSAGVINCDCKKYFQNMEEQFHLMTSFFPVISNNEQSKNDSIKLKESFDRYKRNPFTNKLSGIKYWINRHIRKREYFCLDNQFFFSYKDYCWYNKAGKKIYYDHNHYIRQLWKNHKIKIINNKWVNYKNEELVPQAPHCSHLRDYLKERYNVNIPNNYRHWNGGVFLFDGSSSNFFNKWHEYTMNEIDQGVIKPYDDQGTLAACAWEFGLQNKKTLPIKFNFITDHGNPNVKYNSTSGFTYNNFESKFNPCFLHVYNEFNNENWDIWQGVIEIGRRNKILP